ncbi:MAG: FAD-dependent oxidoreductase [Alphaproteobacteria bacterium]|nr:FAD-dependent oxidoreductase [Alphaproteobacteria bacterium]
MANHLTKQRIAIIGTGISGMGAASILHPHHEIVLYEKNERIGGHSRTVNVSTADGSIPVDTGFIVFNKRNYPLLTKLFEHYEVPIAKSDMSFGASIEDGWLEYGTQHLSNIFAQKRNLLRPQFWGMVCDVWRFNKQARSYLEKDPFISLGACLDALGMGSWYRNYFIVPMGACIWSTPLAQMLDFPASSFLRFFENHGLLSVNDQPQWYTIQGGSKEYIARLTAPYEDRIRLNCGATEVKRVPDGVMVHDTQGGSTLFDQVVFACHADQALAMLQNPSADEARILGQFRYQPNRMVLHSDVSFMPRNKSAWASWVYLSDAKTDDKPYVSLSYWMNNLQPLPTQTPMIVTLNPSREPAKELVHDAANFEHPLFDEAAIRAQAEIPTIQGVDRLWFCGAYQRYGFHEDGLRSAVEMVKQMGIEPAWI